MLRQQGDVRISGLMDSDRFTEYDGTFIFKPGDVDGVYLETSGESGTRATTVFFGTHTCTIPDNDGKLYKLLKELLINKTPGDRISFQNNLDIKP